MGDATLSERLRDHVETATQAIQPRLNAAGARTLAATAAAGMYAAPAVAQVDQAETAVCNGNNIGTLVAVVFVIFAIYLLVLAGLRAMSAFDKMGSTDQNKQLDGKRGLKGSGITAAGAFVPGILAGVFEAIGVSTLSCLVPSDWSIISAIVFFPL